MKKLTERFQLPLDAKLLLFVSPTEEKCVPAEEIFWISNLQAPQAPFVGFQEMALRRATAIPGIWLLEIVYDVYWGRPL